LRLNGTQASLLQASDARGDPRRLRERIALRSHHDERLRLSLQLRLAADFVPMLEVRGLVPPAERVPADVELDDGAVRFAARGREGVLRATPRRAERGADGPGGLGLSPDGLSRRLRIVRPSLPSWLDDVELPS
jgi:hypothetical protein